MLRALLALAISAAAFSQAPVTLQFRSAAPFQAGGNHLPAGTYTVRTIGTGGDVSVLHFDEVDGKAQANVIAKRISLSSAEEHQATSRVLTAQEADGVRITGISFGALPYSFELQSGK